MMTMRRRREEKERDDDDYNDDDDVQFYLGGFDNEALLKQNDPPTKSRVQIEVSPWLPFPAV